MWKEQIPEPLVSFVQVAEPMSAVVVRVTTAMWYDGQGLTYKKTVRYLRRRCAGFNFVEEDARMAGADIALGNITNLHEVADGVYRVHFNPGPQDYWSGNVEEWDYTLVPIPETQH